MGATSPGQPVSHSMRLCTSTITFRDWPSPNSLRAAKDLLWWGSLVEEGAHTRATTAGPSNRACSTPWLYTWRLLLPPGWAMQAAPLAWAVTMATDPCAVVTLPTVPVATAAAAARASATAHPATPCWTAQRSATRGCMAAARLSAARWAVTTILSSTGVRALVGAPQGTQELRRRPPILPRTRHPLLPWVTTASRSLLEPRGTTRGTTSPTAVWNPAIAVTHHWNPGRTTLALPQQELQRTAGQTGGKGRRRIRGSLGLQPVAAVLRYFLPTRSAKGRTRTKPGLWPQDAFTGWSNFRARPPRTTLLMSTCALPQSRWTMKGCLAASTKRWRFTGLQRDATLRTTPLTCSTHTQTWKPALDRAVANWTREYP